MIYYECQKNGKHNSGGNKARFDIWKICEEEGYREIAVPFFPELKLKFLNPVIAFFYIVAFCMKMLVRLGKGDWMIIQNQLYGAQVMRYTIPLIRRMKKCRFIVVIHDLESIRKSPKHLKPGTAEKLNKTDTVFLDAFDKIISHNRHMTEHLVNVNHIDRNKIVNIELFDYLGSEGQDERTRTEVPSVVIAGGLLRWKSGYVYQMQESPKDLIVHLYGHKFDEKARKENMVYHGIVDSWELPSVIEGDFGLVWDGNVTEGCGGDSGNYLRYNNPHKTSLYLASKIPVIVWKEAAMADFVLENKVGIAVDGLDDLAGILKNVTSEEYEELRNNAKLISDRVHTGYYFRRALRECIGQ